MFSKKIVTTSLVTLGLLATSGFAAIAQQAPTRQSGDANRTQPGNSQTVPNSNRNDSMNRTSPNRANRANQLSAIDSRFMIQAAQGNLAEIQTGQLALQKSTNDATRQYAQRMINEHTQAQRELAQLAAARGVQLPTTVDAAHQAMMARMQQLSGQQFDREYLNSQVQDHNRTALLFQNHIRQSRDPDLKAFSSRMLPAIQDHLADARSMVRSARR